MSETTTARQHERAPLDLYINKIVGDEPHMMRTRNISAGGVYVCKLIEPSFGEHQQVGLEMKLPNCDDVIWALGEIIREEFRSGADFFAIRFVRIAETDRKMIEEYVTKTNKSLVGAAQ